MALKGVIAQLRTTDLERMIRFYTDVLGFKLAFRYRDFYAGVEIGGQMLHLKLVDTADASIAEVAAGEHFHLYLLSDDIFGDAERLRQHGVDFVMQPHPTPWGIIEFVIRDDQGHTIHIGQSATQ